MNTVLWHSVSNISNENLLDMTDDIKIKETKREFNITKLN